MNMILLGYKPLDFVNDRQEQVKGTNLFLAFEEEGVSGQIVEKLFIKENLVLPELTPGMTLDVAFNRKGKPIQVTAAPTSQRLTLSK